MKKYCILLALCFLANTPVFAIKVPKVVKPKGVTKAVKAPNTARLHITPVPRQAKIVTPPLTTIQIQIATNGFAPS